MTSSIEEDVNQTALSYLLDGRSKRAVHVICLRLAPFCKAHETLWDGVKRLETMLRISTDANCQHLVVVTTLVLVCFMVDNSTNMRIDTSADLNKCWLGILPDVVGPHARTMDAPYWADAQKLAICVLYTYFPCRYGEKLMRLKTHGSLPSVHGIVVGIQAGIRAEQARRKVVGSVVAAALSNVLHEARLRKRRDKKKRRKLECTSPMPSTSSGYASLEVSTDMQAGEAEPTSECQVALSTLTVKDGNSTATEECVVCFALLGSKRPLFTCGHALCCAVCSMEMEVCPMCRQSVSIVMEIFV
jgi:hypothetical protein